MRSIYLLLIALAVPGCGDKKESRELLLITWDNNKAAGVSIDQSLFPYANADSISAKLKVSVQGSEYGVLGTVEVDHDVIRFTPSVQLQRGQTYDIFYGNDKIHSFTIPLDTNATPPKIVGSYPSCDTVPENILKMYLAFDQPMMEGRSKQFVSLFDATTGDTVEGAFLDLQPELWNEDQTVLTLWFDPGRVKRDLIPNKELGAVLVKDHRYVFLVSSGWKSKSGQAAGSGYQRYFFTGPRDSGKPDVATWSVTTPKAGSSDTLLVRSAEPIDWALLSYAISVVDNDKVVPGTIAAGDCEQSFRFMPADPWPAGAYRLVIESRLEDLAGNNLNRLFESDATDPNGVSPSKPFYIVGFTIK
ncbi:MAG TPA: Ig-like domain-containing protein [Cyclobacteriaceae bacterium]|nr:Ig-like domain-containing protein [Cyclobacteriaceae bacterium]